MTNVYATLNPSDKSANITLSGGDLTATGNGLWYSVRATQGKSSGKWYWEITCTTVGGSGMFAGGIMNSSAVLTNYPGANVNGRGYHAASGNIFNNGDTGVPGITYTSGAVIGVALDMDNGECKFYKNNTQSGSTLTGLTGTWYPALSPGDFPSQGSILTVNFGASALTYTPPSGFNSGVYEAGSVNSNFFALMS